MNQKQIKSELSRLDDVEKKFIEKNKKLKEPEWQKKIDKYMPDALSDTLNGAFCKAFEIIFEKGTGIIEKTYNKEKKEQDFKVNEYSADLRDNKSSVKKFSRNVMGRKTLNIAISAVEGTSMGIFGMGIPDIPVFLAVILKSIYEISIDYGFKYDTPEEQMFILKLIEASLLHGDEIVKANLEIDDWIEASGSGVFSTDRDTQIKMTSRALSDEMLYLKFIQGMPVVGIVGGVSDVIYQKKISDYAAMKYKKRFLMKHFNEDVVM